MATSRPRSDGLGLTKVGTWFLAFLAVLALAATNTGNNGLYLVVAMMLGTAVVGHHLAGRNVRSLEFQVGHPGELFARRPARLEVEITNRGLLPRWLLSLSVRPRDVVALQPLPPKNPPPRSRRAANPADPRPADPAPELARPAPLLVPQLGRRSTARHRLEVLPLRRGRCVVSRIHVASLFPLGFFLKGRSYPLELEILVYPQILGAGPRHPEERGGSGEEPSRRRGWGHELLGLRSYRHGDDPRGIHWKQSARTGELVFQEREIDENRRFLIVFDNAVGALDAAGRRRFEHRVSEAATAALDYLAAGFEVGLLTRDDSLPAAVGPHQRRAILEALALVEPRAAEAGVLLPRSGSPHLHLTLDSDRDAA